MTTEYINRYAAKCAYLHHRKTWSRESSLYLTQYRFAACPVKRLACAITLMAYSIPLDGVYVEVRP